MPESKRTIQTKRLLAEPFMQLRLVILLLCITVGCTTSDTSLKPTNTKGIRTDLASPTPEASPTVPLPQQTMPNSASQLKPKLNACALLTSQDIESVQGEGVKETKLSESSAGGFNVSQCFFTLPTFTNSISLTITQRAEGAGARDPKQFWKDNFHADKEERDNDRDRDRRKEKGEERPPQKIAGVGDEAFWMASRAAGILYVLKGSRYVRISVGGRGDQQIRVGKAKALAQKVIERL